MLAVVRRILFFGPLIFAFGFLAPLIMQVMARAGWTAPFGLSPLVFALCLAGVLGLVAQTRGRWLW
jgi:hypothetical protein